MTGRQQNAVGGGALSDEPTPEDPARAIILGYDPRLDWTALGDNVNIAARLAEKAGPGEALISDAAYAAVGVDLGPQEQRQMELKGRRKAVGVRVLHVTPR